MRFSSSNTILYCRAWRETVAFYKTILNLPVLFSTDWFVEFELSEGSRLSIADSGRTTVNDCSGAGVTISLEVNDLDRKKAYMDELGVNTTPVKAHSWNARVFYFNDPEGHRIEFWQKK